VYTFVTYLAHRSLVGTADGPSRMILDQVGITGNFWMADPDDQFFAGGGFTDLLLYNAPDGRGDFYLYEPPEPTPIQLYASYVSCRSAMPGDTIGFHVSSQVGPYAIDVLSAGRARDLHWIGRTCCFPK